MAKRFQPLRELSLGKKPKLDIAAKIATAAASSSTGLNNIRSKLVDEIKINTEKTNLKDFWDEDDDDDDVILLATQVAEQKAITTAAITGSEITFSEFAKNVHAITSTQQLKPPNTVESSTKTELKSALSLEQQLLDEETHEDGVNVNQLKSASQLNNSSAMRRQLASERQMKYLMDRIDNLKNENLKLQKEVAESKEFMNSKIGESSLLRDEIRYLKQQIQDLRMEKILVGDATKIECKAKLAELQKIVQAKETEIKLKSVENSVLKMKHADETRRSETNFNLTTIAPAGSGEIIYRNKETQTFCDRNNRQLVYMGNFVVPESFTCYRIPEINSISFEQSANDEIWTNQRTLFKNELNKLQIISTQLQYSKRNCTMQIIQIIIDSVRSTFSEFRELVSNLDCSNNCMLPPYRDYDEHNQDHHLRRSLTQPTALFNGETAIDFRRYVAALDIICWQELSISIAIIQNRFDESSLLQILNEAISKLGYSNDVNKYFGVLEALAALLKCWLTNCLNKLENDDLELVFGLLKQLVFTRPNAWIFHEISICMIISTQSVPFQSKFCINSASTCFKMENNGSIHSFSEDSCLLQVYCGLLSIIFCTNQPMHSKFYELLITTTNNHMRFVYQCFTKLPHFVLNALPLFDEDDVNVGAEENQKPSDSNSVSRDHNPLKKTVPDIANRKPLEAIKSFNNKNLDLLHTKQHSCECYEKLALSTVILTFQTLQQWLLKNKSEETPQVIEISHLSVVVLNIIFRDYFTNTLFQHFEETTKYYLSLISTWWTEHSNELKFDSIHLRLLSSLKEAHFMITPLHEEGSIENIANDLKDWHLLSNGETTEAELENVPEIVTELNCTENFDPLTEESINVHFKLIDDEDNGDDDESPFNNKSL